jgi:hypothetical protein
MIERDEAHVLPRSLASFRALISAGCSPSYCVVDGGSVDGSASLIPQLMDGVPGEVHIIPQPKPLDDFAGARNGALDRARLLAPWMWMLDADDEIQMKTGFIMPDLKAGGYAGGYKVLIKNGSDEFWRTVLVRSDLPWRYVGEMHENIECAVPCEVLPLEGIWIQVHPGEGARSKDPKQKFLNDAAVLRKALEKSPGNLRHLFYLAQSLRDAGELEASLKVYEERGAHTEGWAEETYFALLQVARIKWWLNRPVQEVVDAFLAASQFRSCRAESFGMLAEYLRGQKLWRMAVHFASLAMAIPRPADILFVTVSWYEWKSRDELAISAYWAGDFQTCRRSCMALLDNPKLPADQRERVKTNLAFANKALGMS